MFELSDYLKYSFEGCASLEQLIERFDDLKQYYINMKNDGLEMESPGVQDAWMHFYTENAVLAEKYEFQEIEDEESEPD